MRKAVEDSVERDEGLGSARALSSVLSNRWPTLLALLVAGLSWGPSPLKGLSEALILFALGYLIAAVVQRRRALG